MSYQKKQKARVFGSFILIKELQIIPVQEIGYFLHIMSNKILVKIYFFLYELIMILQRIKLMLQVL